MNAQKDEFQSPVSLQIPKIRPNPTTIQPNTNTEVL